MVFVLFFLLDILSLVSIFLCFFLWPYVLNMHLNGSDKFKINHMPTQYTITAKNLYHFLELCLFITCSHYFALAARMWKAMWKDNTLKDEISVLIQRLVKLSEECLKLINKTISFRSIIVTPLIFQFYIIHSAKILVLFEKIFC